MNESDHTPYDEMLEELFAENDLDDVVKRTRLFAERRLRRHGNLALRYPADPIDFVQQAFTQTLDASRPFPFDWPGRTLLAHLCSCVDSYISHSGEKAGRRGQHLSIGERSDDSEQNVGTFFEDRLVAATTVDGYLLVLNEAHAFAKTLPADLKELVLYRIKNVDASDEECARELGKGNVNDIYNMNRRLKRSVEKWQGMSVKSK